MKVVSDLVSLPSIYCLRFEAYQLLLSIRPAALTKHSGNEILAGACVEIMQAVSCPTGRLYL